MNYSRQNISMIKALSNAPGPSGFEDAVLDIVRNELVSLIAKDLTPQILETF